MNVLVSGVAGDIGFGVGRILKDWGLFDRVYGIDISGDHPASIIFDEVNVAPKATDRNYITWLTDYISKNRITIFIPTSELEIKAISSNIDSISSICKILINSCFITEICLDKYKTLQFLNENGIAVPQNGLIGTGPQPSKFPIIIKPRSGQGSKGIHKILSKNLFKKAPIDYVWQEYLSGAQEEYTCFIYTTKNWDPRILIFKRALRGGYTEKGIVVNDKIIQDYILMIAQKFNTSKCLLNIQLRLTDDGPRVFEINPRLSSTLVFRDKLGFCDLRWWVSEHLGQTVSPYEQVPAGIKIYRGNTEYFLYPDPQNFLGEVK